MKADVILYAAEASPLRVANANVAVMDVFRATSVIVQALRNGARAVVPTVSVDDAFAMCDKFGREQSLVGGERQMEKVRGFDLGNSPQDYTPEMVAGKTVILSTTNGTRAILNSRHAAKVRVAAFLNMEAVCRALTADGRDIVLVCSGRLDRFTAEDGLCAGAMAGILSKEYGYKLTDIADVMRRMYESAEHDMPARLADSRHYNDMLAKGLGSDIDFSLQRNIYDIAPYYNAHGEIVL